MRPVVGRGVQGQKLGQHAAHLGAFHDGVDKPVLERELRRLEALGQLLLDGVADDPLAGEPDERAGEIGPRRYRSWRAHDAVTPPVVGSVSTVMKGRRAAP